MIKRIISFAVLLVVIVYLALALTAFNRKPAGQVCQRIEVLVKDSLDAGFVLRDDIVRMLSKQGVDPIGRQMDDIRTNVLEEQLAGHPMIENVECYKTPGGVVCVEVKQRIPVIRVLNNRNESYYVDNKGKVMPQEMNNSVCLVVATGYINKDFATRDLYPLGMYLKENKFWNAQIEQIHVTSEGELELVPRVGDHIIALGKAEGFEDKLDRLKVFYGKVLNQVGWNKYRRINLEFENQIICTKKE